MLPDEKADIGQIGKYKVLAKIGQGAMGEVYKAHDPVLGRFVAIKTISKGISNDEKARERFQKEAQSAAQLNHPNIITVYDFGEEDGTIYMAMELLEGTDLRELIEKRALTKIAEKLAVMEQICDGLAFAHAKGVVHRDLKPGNIHILPSGQVKIMDFGLARRSEDAARTGVIMGTPYYMAPEQAQGERATTRSDIFSLGAVFYELLSGRRPFTGDSIPSVLFSVVHREPESLANWEPDAPALVAVVRRALTKEAEERYEDGTALREALQEAREEMFGAPAGSRRAPAGLKQEPAKPLPVPLSEASDTDPELREALIEMEEYLTDRLPPLIVADSVTRVMRAAPEAVTADLYTWAMRQAEAQAAPLADLLFHALRKLHMMGEFQLVDPDALDVFIARVGETALDFCAPEERSRLRKSLLRLGESEMVRTGPIGMLHRTAIEAPPDPAERTLTSATSTSTMGPGPLSNNLRRLSLLEQRLQQAEVERTTPKTTAPAASSSPRPSPRRPRRRAASASSRSTCAACARSAWPRGRIRSSVRSARDCPTGSFLPTWRARPPASPSGPKSKRCAASSPSPKSRSRWPGDSGTSSTPPSSSSTRGTWAGPCRCSSWPSSSTRRRRSTPGSWRPCGGRATSPSTSRASANTWTSPSTTSNCAWC